MPLPKLRHPGLLLGLLLGAGLALMLGRALEPSAETRPTSSLRSIAPGQAVRLAREASSFDREELDGGQRYGPADFRGRVLVLNFWASWCTACDLEASSLEAAWSELRPAGVQFLGVDHEDTRSAAVAFQDRDGVSYPSVFDPTGRVARDYGALGLPTTFVIDPYGCIRFQITGRTDRPSLVRIVSVVLAEHPPGETGRPSGHACPDSGQKAPIPTPSA